MIRPDEVLSCRVNKPILNVATHPLRRSRQHRHGLGRCLASLDFGAHDDTFTHLLLQIRVKALFRVELWAVAGQVKENRRLDDHPARLALVAVGGDHGELLAGVTPVVFSTSAFGALLNAGALTFKRRIPVR